VKDTASGGLLDPQDLAWVEAGYRELLPVGPGVETHLRGALEQTLAHPGSLTRAQIAFDSARIWGLEREAARELAVAIEYLHTASLLFDDLPFMDDARERRGSTCAHRLYGEGAAVLAALALVTRAYEMLWRSFDRVAEDCRGRASSLVASCLGLEGIVNGQALDLGFVASRQGSREVLEVAAGKTVALTRLTLLLPALVGGAPEAVLDALERLAVAWGHAYQIVDDFRDGGMGSERSGKTMARDAVLGRPNLPRAEGQGQALARAVGELERAASALGELAGLAPVPRALGRLFERLQREVTEIAGLLHRRAVA
jgi:geranylgeranyl pyrophosphate synthase